MDSTALSFPIPVVFGPHDADWWMVWLTSAGIVVTAAIAGLTLVANVKASNAQRVAMEAYTQAVDAMKTLGAEQTALLRATADRLNEAEKARAVVPPAVTWALDERIGKRERWRLINTSGTVAENAYVELAYEASWKGIQPEDIKPEDIGPGESMTFWIAQKSGSSPSTLVAARWDEAGATHSQTFIVS